MLKVSFLFIPALNSSIFSFNNLISLSFKLADDILIIFLVKDNILVASKKNVDFLLKLRILMFFGEFFTIFIFNHDF